MSLLLVNTPTGIQELITIGVGGSYYDLARVLWDERVDGDMPSITLGGMTRVGNSLVFSQVQLDEYTTAQLPSLKEKIWGRIITERTRRIYEGGYLAAGNWYHSDQLSRTQQIGLVMLGANIPAGLKWQTMNDGEVTMTQTLAGQIFAAAAASDAAIFTAAKTHKANMEASATPETYNYLTGWPTVYGE